MKKILIISHSSLDIGGAESDFDRLLSHFSSLNDKYEVYCLLPKGKGVKKYSQYCKDYYIFRNGVFPSFRTTFSEYIKYFIKGFKQLKEIRRILRINNFDLVIINVSVLIIPIIYFKFKKHKIIVFIREFIKPDFCRNLIYKVLNYTSNYLFTVSDILKNDFIKITGNNNISTVYSAIEKNQTLKSITEINISDTIDQRYADALLSSRFKILNIGPVCKLKNQVIIIEALNLLKKNNDDVPLFLNIGDFNTSTSYVKRLINLIKFYGLQDYCFFLGILGKDITNSIIANVDIIIISSLSEGMPLVMVEAMEFGKPLIVTNVGGIPEIIVDGYNGLLIEPNASQLYDALKKLISDKFLRDNIVNNTRKTAEKYFDLNKNLLFIEEISSRIIES